MSSLASRSPCLRGSGPLESHTALHTEQTALSGKQPLPWWEPHRLQDTMSLIVSDWLLVFSHKLLFCVLAWNPGLPLYIPVFEQVHAHLGHNLFAVTEPFAILLQV